MKNLLKFLGVVIALITLIVAISDSERTKQFYDTVVDYIHSKEKDYSTPGDPHVYPPQDKLSRFMEGLKERSLESRKLRFIEDNPDLLPDHLSLDDLNSILDLFPTESRRLKVTKIFASRVKDNYSEREFDRFKNQFPLESRKLEAMKLIRGF